MKPVSLDCEKISERLKHVYAFGRSDVVRTRPVVVLLALSAWHESSSSSAKNATVIFPLLKDCQY